MKSMLKFLTAGLTLSFGMAFPAIAQDKINLRFGFETSIDSAQGVGAQEMVRVADKLSKGKITFELCPDSKLGPGKKMAEMVQKGELDIFQGGTGVFSAMDSRLNVFDIPYLFASVEQAYKVLDSKFGREMLASLEPHGFKGLSFWENGIRSITNNVRPITKPEDLVGLKMRVPPNPVHLAMWKIFGTEPTTLTFGKIYENLKNGTVDGQDHPIAPTYGGKFYEVQKYLSLTKHIYGPLILVANLEKFKAMPKSHQEILLKAAHAGAVAQRKFSNENEARFIADMKAKGMQVNEVDIKPFRDKVRPEIEKEFIAKNGDAWLKKINGLLKGK